MKYSEALQLINPFEALKTLKIKGKEEGAYIHFPCPKCQAEAVIRAYGEKKNIWYCPSCKLSGHIISLAMDIQKLDYEESKKLLLGRASAHDKLIEDELSLNYELEWCSFMQNEELKEEVCAYYGVGKPKEKAILAGHIAFTILNEHRKKIAYVGQRISDGKKWFPKNFNPDFYLYNFYDIDPEEEVILTPDMLECVRLLGQKKQAVSNFWLSYISFNQLEMLQRIKYLTVQGFRDNTKGVATKLAMIHGGFHRFI